MVTIQRQDSGVILSSETMNLLRRLLGTGSSYFNECMLKDVCADLPLSHVHRLLVNAQNPGHVSQTHTDFNHAATSIIYHAYGDSGCTTFATGEKVEFKQGRIIYFDSRLEHDGDPPTKDIRISLGAICPHLGVQFS